MKNRACGWKSVSLHSHFDFTTHSEHLCMLREYTAEHNEFKLSRTWKWSKPRGWSCACIQGWGSSCSAALCESLVSCVRCFNHNKTGTKCTELQLGDPYNLLMWRQVQFSHDSEKSNSQVLVCSITNTHMFTLRLKNIVKKIYKKSLIGIKKSWELGYSN